MIGEKTVIPAGSTVSGVVTAVKPAEKGDRAMLDLGISSMSVEGREYATKATTEAIVAGSTRARNLGAIAGGAAAGALIGRAVGGSGKLRSRSSRSGQIHGFRAGLGGYGAL